jgi:hypothetical protein
VSIKKINNQGGKIERKKCIPYANFIKQIEGISHGNINASNREYTGE